jgi:SAM-dependent methyltransferase
MLEIGCAAGVFLQEAQSSGYDCLGIEPNANMARHGRDILGVTVSNAHLHEVDLAGNQFDVVCAFHVVEHLPEPLAAVRKVVRWLRPGGWFVVEVPNAMSVAAQRLGVEWSALDLPYHAGHHGPRSLSTLLQRAGLEVACIDTIPFARYVSGMRVWRLARGVSEAIRVRAPVSLKPHPSRHQLLRGIARKPTA